MDGARDTVGETDIELGEGVLGVDRGLRKVSDGSSLDHVLHGETLDSLVLGNTSGAVRAPDKLDVTPSLLVSTTTAALERHLDRKSVV